MKLCMCTRGCCVKSVRAGADLLLSHVGSSAGTEGDEERRPALLGQALHQVPVDVGGLAGTCTVQTN